VTKLDTQYDIVNYTPASASPVEANFDRIEQHVNQEVIERDGTVAMRAQLKLVGDPVTELDAAPKQYVDQVLPIGIIMMFGGAAVPPGGRWGTCNGAELQSASYPALFAVIGNNFSPAGTPAGRFHLPNLVDRVPLGNGGLAALGATGGSKDATLVAHDHAPTGPHSHGMKNHVHGDDHHHTGTTNAMDRSGNHRHSIGTGGGVVAPSIQGVVRVDTSGTPSGFNYVAPTESGDYNIDHLHTFGTNYKSQQGYGAYTGAPNDNTTDAAWSANTDVRGSTATNANLPPYLGVAYIMRIS